jgi:branched-chain amino acid transport system permease protein
MVILGGMGQFFGPLVGAFTLVVLNQQITSYTEYWPLVLGLLLIVLLYAFPAGLLGTIADLVKSMRGRRDA